MNEKIQSSEVQPGAAPAVSAWDYIRSYRRCLRRHTAGTRRIHLARETSGL